MGTVWNDTGSFSLKIVAWECLGFRFAWAIWWNKGFGDVLLSWILNSKIW